MFFVLKRETETILYVLPALVLLEQDLPILLSPITIDQPTAFVRDRSVRISIVILLFVNPGR